MSTIPLIVLGLVFDLIGLFCLLLVWPITLTRSVVGYLIGGSTGAAAGLVVALIPGYIAFMQL